MVTILYWIGLLCSLKCTSQCSGFDGYIITISVGRSTRFRLDISVALGLLHYSLCSNIMVACTLYLYSMHVLVNYSRDSVLS